ncbi:MAG: cation-translocating P-type ATPase [Lachnospiraceae bacterium]|jgi:Ca2+-transporting ATPase
MEEYLREPQQVMRELGSSEQGLTEEQAKKKLAETGPNKIREAKKESIFHKFLMELADPMIIILIVAAVISGITAAYSGEGFSDVIIIMAVVILNSVLGVYQESKAEEAIEALKKMSAATAKVVRGGKERVIPAEELVPGDLIILEAGDAVPADARLTESASMKTEESALTGESVPVDKNPNAIEVKPGQTVPLGDRRNMVYTGTSVVYGRGRAVITGTGMNTEMGKIADAITKAEDTETPLQKKLDELSKKLSVLVLVICAAIFVVDIARALATGTGLNGNTVLDMFMVAVSLAVAAIPEGLAAVVTILLSIGVTRMSKNNAIIRKMTAVETLGCTQVICTDKTGTLTQNRMTVVKHETDDLPMLETAMALCNDAELQDGGVIGEPTEAALVADAQKEGFPKPELKEKYPRVGEAPFDSLRKMMSTLHPDGKGGVIQFTKGAPDVVLGRCAYVDKNGEEVPMTDELRAQIAAQNKAMADNALRVLCAAYRRYPEKPETENPDELEQNLTYIGLCGMIDPVRPEVKPAIDDCREAGIRPVMITGDHKDTAVAIAKELGILGEGQEAITGSELDKISDEDLADNIEKYSVYARVQPEHKMRIVNAWQKRGKITAMTGDGVNDAPSIKAADIGVGMGITGTDVTKNVADMILADDNFATIVRAVGEGRRIYDNIRKAIEFLLSSNLAEVLTVFIATLLGFTILEPAHLLWINLITDSLPAIALGMEEAEKNIMHQPPRDSHEGIFAGGMGMDIFLQGVCIAAITLVSYFIGDYMETGMWRVAESADGMTMAFLTLSMIEIFHSFNMRSRRNSIFRLGTHNRYLYLSLVLSFLLTLMVIYVPFLRAAFGFENISAVEYLAAVGLAVLIIPIVEAAKAVERRREARKSA